MVDGLNTTNVSTVQLVASLSLAKIFQQTSQEKYGQPWPA